MADLHYRPVESACNVSLSYDDSNWCLTVLKIQQRWGPRENFRPGKNLDLLINNRIHENFLIISNLTLDFSCRTRFSHSAYSYAGHFLPEKTCLIAW